MVFLEEEPLSGRNRRRSRFARPILHPVLRLAAVGKWGALLRAARTRSSAAIALVATAGAALTLATSLPARVWAAPNPDAAKTAAARVVETTFESVDATVAAQWDFPAQTPAPLVVIIPASTGVDRNGLPPGFTDDPEIGIYAKLATKLVREGFAVFRYDAPGTGRSGRGRFATDRSTALEAYGRAVDHARIDTERVFLFGHSAGTQTVASIYPRFVDRNPVAGVIMLSNRVGESESIRIDAPALLVVTEKNPDDHYQNGRFPADARDHAEGKELETTLVTVPEADHSLLIEVQGRKGKEFAIHPHALNEIVQWLRNRLGRILES